MTQSSVIMRHLLYFISKPVMQRLVGGALWCLKSFTRTDRFFIGLIRSIGLRGLPRAQAALLHYCKGTGDALRVSLDRLFAEDCGVAASFAEALSEPVNGAAGGRVHIPQWRFANADWRFALGSIDIRWRRHRDGIVARLEGRYDWSPHERRITRPVHVAADSLKQQGAAAFDLCSDPAVVPIAKLSAMGHRGWIPRDRLYM